LFRLERPTDEQLRSILEEQKDAPFSYPEVGASRRSVLPNGYHIDRYRIRLGTGKATFLAAKAAMQGWELFDRALLRIFPKNLEIREGSTVAIIPSHLAFYSINLCRIVYVLESEEPVHLFGFAYGTLSDHAASGEERFTVSWNTSDQSVWYEILAFSRPRAFLARVGYPISRAIQKRFARASLAAMRKAVYRAIAR
jgi:uncharacterized protein (UPF0548 family)